MWSALPQLRARRAALERNALCFTADPRRVGGFTQVIESLRVPAVRGRLGEIYDGFGVKTCGNGILLSDLSMGGAARPFGYDTWPRHCDFAPDYIPKLRWCRKCALIERAAFLLGNKARRSAGDDPPIANSPHVCNSALTGGKISGKNRVLIDAHPPAQSRVEPCLRGQLETRVPQVRYGVPAGRWVGSNMNKFNVGRPRFSMQNGARVGH